MTNEHTLIYETSIPIPFTVADGTGIEKGTILAMSDPMTAAAATVSGSVIAGIAAEEKIASDGITKLAVYRTGIFKGTASGSITVGDAVICSGLNNTMETAPLNQENLMGISLETATDTQTFLYELKPMTVNVK